MYKLLTPLYMKIIYREILTQCQNGCILLTRGQIMGKVARVIAEKRPEEILSACRELYDTKPFREITLKDISGLTSLSWPSIYNYYQTKEEIFLALLQDEYRQWGEALERMLNENDTMSIDDFASGLAASLEGRERMLRILCMNLYEIEENSRMERLVSFKKEYKRTTGMISSCIGKFFPQMSSDDRSLFLLELLSFLYGIYPYTHPTEKQRDAMRLAEVESTEISIHDLTRRFVSSLLRGLV